MRRFAWLIGALGALTIGLCNFGCGGGGSNPPDGDADSDADSDADTDADTDSDADSDGDAVEVTVSSTMEGADILVNGARVGERTTATFGCYVGDEIDVAMDEFLSIPQEVEGPGEITVPMGRDIGGGWRCDRDPFIRDVGMAIDMGSIWADEMDPDQNVEVRGDTLFSPAVEGPIGSISDVGSSLEYTIVLTHHCTRD